MQFNFRREICRDTLIVYAINNTDCKSRRSAQARFLAKVVPLRRVASDRDHVGDYLCTRERESEAAERTVPESSIHVSSD